MQIVWLSIILAIIAGLTILMVFRKPKLSKIEAYSNFLAEISSFSEGQAKYNTDQLTKEIPLNPGIDFGGIESSIQNASVNNVPAPKRVAESLANRLFTDSTSKFSEADAKFCRGASHPSKFPPRNRRSTVGCGWWYVNDPSVPSVGVLGSRQEALFTTGLPAAGEYIWDIATASKKEDIKRCKQITNCSVVGVSDLRGKCGFCPSKGHAIPTKSNGSEKYPSTIPCDTDLILLSQNCPVQPAMTGIAALENDGAVEGEAMFGADGEVKKKTKKKKSKDGGGVGDEGDEDDSGEGGDDDALYSEAVFASEERCRSLGRPSDDNSLRLYTKAECTQLDPSATHLPTGECIRVDGGSFSIECRNLNARRNRIIGICDPDDDGILSRECLLSLSKGMGYTSGGAIVAMLTDPLRTLTDLDATAIQILTNIGVSIPDALYGSGDIDADSAKELYYKIMLVSSQGTKELYRQAANWLVYGTNDFNPCDLADDAKGPFLPQCIQQQFRKAGCQPAGALYPKTLDQFGQFTYSKWANVKTQFADLYSGLSDNDGDVQDKAVKDCLGIGVYRYPPTECPELVGMWQRASGDDRIRAMYNLTISQRGGGYYVEGWPGTGAGNVEYDKDLKRGVFKLQLYDNGNPLNVPFSYNPEKKTLIWGTGRSRMVFRQLK
jgi:hypothetical protein